MSRWWDSRAWPEIGAVADQVACPHRARPEAAHQDQHTIMVRSLCGTVRLAGRPLGSPTHPIHKPWPRSLPRFWSVSLSACRGTKGFGPGAGGSVRWRSSQPCWIMHMAEALAMLQVGQHAIDQRKQDLAPDPGPKL
jgi:hypothetical protein